MYSLSVVGHTCGSKELILNDMEDNISNWSDIGREVLIINLL